jgi:erythromycin 12 hydroxylase
MTALTDVAPVTSDESALLDWLTTMRDEHPVWQDRWGVWHVFRHADVTAVLRDPARFSNDTSRVITGVGPAPGMITGIDPPEHRALRQVVSAAFTPRTIAKLEPRIREVTRDLLDRAGERFDLVDALARPLPITIIAELLGLPARDHDRFRLWTEALFDMQGGDPAELDVGALMATTFGPLGEYLGEKCRTRRADPGDDLISALVTTEVEGRVLDDEEATNFSIALMLAGHLTTTVQLANVVRTLDEHPEHWAAMRADPGLIPGVVEEVLRFRTPFSWIQRVTTTAVELGGVTIPAGVMVTPWLLSANRDPRAHVDPDRFDPRRGIGGAGQLALGHGIHFCLGAPLARLETRVVLEELLRRWDRLVVDPDPDDPTGSSLLPYRYLVVGTRRLPVHTGTARLDPG